MNTIILFGAGAEIDLGLSCGGKFAKEVLGLDSNRYDNAIKEFYKGINDDWYPKCIVKPWKEEDLLIAAQKKKFLSENTIIKSKKDFDDMVKNTVAELSEQKKQELLESFTSYMGILDERFHTLISPKSLGPNKFWSVIACYWRAYLSLVNCIFDNIDTKWVMDNPDKVYEKMVNCTRKQSSKNNYYNIVSKMKDKSDICIMTTNYTPFCHTLTGIDEERIAYLHGSFKWFERPREMEVLDASKNDFPETNHRKHDYFPFIFLQSGIKPIISMTQIREYAKVKSFFDEDHRIVIVGYKANQDDNHINSFIRESILNGKEVVYLDYDGIEYSELIRKFRIDRDIGNLIHKKIKSGNRFDEFRKALHGNQ